MNENEKLARTIYTMLKNLKQVILLPTDKSLEDTFKFSLLLTCVSAISSLLGFFTFISWQGALTCTAFLLFLLFIERRENDALLRMYKHAQLSAQKVKQRAKDASASRYVQRGTKRTATNKKEVRKK